MAVLRDGEAAVFQLGAEAQSVRSHGFYVTVEPDTVRGSPRSLGGVDRIHLCRNLTCGEDGGQHFLEYGLVKKPERFQFAQAGEGAKQTGKWIWDYVQGSQSSVRR